ncbi:MAG TPA: efflux RND transporter permease subunit, partial [Hyphomicrobiaceae bacterium]|nr:efflux RND transporter permease subunit [Hyphomicrobiaceae bacterium]
RFLVVAMAAVLLVFGAVRLRTMPVDVFPEFAPPMIEVQTEALGLSPWEVEHMITMNLEELLSGVAWVRTIRSESVTGLSTVRLILEPGTDLIRARQMVQERLTLAYTLPNVSKAPVVLPPVSTTGRVMMVGLTSKEFTPVQLSVIAQWTIKPKLLGVAGVANVAIWGDRRRQLQVQIDPERLRAHGLKQDQIVTTAGDAVWVSHLSFLKASVPGSGGWIDTPKQRFEIEHALPISSAQDLARVPVDGAAGLRLGDVAKVVEGHPNLIGDAIINDSKGLLLVIEKFPEANTLEVTRRVEAALEAMKPGLRGIDVDPTLFRAASFVEAALNNHTTVLLVGALLVALAFGALLVDWRTAVVGLVAIPSSVLAAGVVLSLTGATLNSMIAAGLVLALAAIIDDAVVFTDNIAQRLRQRRRQGSTDSAASIIYDAALEVRRPIIFATLIALLAVTPLFAMGGVIGAFLKPLALSYALALAASLAVALTVTPALALFLLDKAANEPGEAPLFRTLRPRYDALLARVVGAPRPVLVTAAVLAVAGLSVWPWLGQSLIPVFKERDVLISWDAVSGTSQLEMQRIVTHAAQELRTIPGVRNISAHVGRAITGDQVVGINSSRLWASLDPKADYDATVAAIRETVNGYAGIDRNVRSYLQETISKVLTGSIKPVVVRVYGKGQAQEALDGLAEEVRQALSRIDGLVDLQVQRHVEEPIVKVEVNLEAAARAGLKPGDVRRQASTIFSGLEVGKIFEHQKMFEVVVWSPSEARSSLSSIRDLLLETPDGGHVRLGDLAEVTVTPSPAAIPHEALSPYVDVGANVAGRDVASVVRDVERQLQHIKVPLELRTKLLGEYAEQQTARDRILVLAAAAAIAIFLLLQAAFGSWRLATVSFLALSATLGGGVLAAVAGGGVLSLGSLVGFLAVLGIAARQAIVLILHYQHLEQHEGESFGPGLVLRGTRERLRPILTSAAATALALLPLVYFGGIPGLEIEHPTAVVMLGGLVAATLVNLFVVPALYLVFGSSPELETERVVS